MSRYGPAPTTRLVLYAHSLFMDRDGTHCWVGVRRLAIDTGLAWTMHEGTTFHGHACKFGEVEA